MGESLPTLGQERARDFEGQAGPRGGSGVSGNGAGPGRQTGNCPRPPAARTPPRACRVHSVWRGKPLATSEQSSGRSGSGLPGRLWLCWERSGRIRGGAGRREAAAATACATAVSAGTAGGGKRTVTEFMGKANSSIIPLLSISNYFYCTCLFPCCSRDPGVIIWYHFSQSLIQFCMIFSIQYWHVSMVLYNSPLKWQHNLL